MEGTLIAADATTRALKIFEDSASAHQRFLARGVDTITAAAEAITRSTQAGGKLIAFGNGGSASDAQHLVAELVGRFERERRALAAIALTPDSNVVTALANDYSYDIVFSRQIEALGREGDVAFGISTSGRSKNVEIALAAAKARGLVTIALTGRDGGAMGAGADIHINVPAESTARIQEVHRTILHAMCSIVEDTI
jgi:D-sedoheptulose 7-phosphate isomerase